MPCAPVAPIEVMVMPSLAAWPVSSFSLLSSRMLATDDVKAKPLLLAETDPGWLAATYNRLRLSPEDPATQTVPGRNATSHGNDNIVRQVQR